MASTTLAGPRAEPEPMLAAARGGRPTAGAPHLLLFSVTAFLAAGLLFAVEPMVAKMLLPRLGGSPAVWNTALVFFQGALLAGYGFAHLSIGRLGLRRQPILQAVLVALPLTLLPVAVPHGWQVPAGGQPALWVLLVLTVMVGAPFAVLATVSPTLQRWFAASDHRTAANPYVLYATGNAGSLLALLAYPIVLEPRLDLSGQARLWSAGYAMFAVLLVGCALCARRWSAAAEGSPGTAAAPASPVSVGRRRRAWWVLLAAVPSALLLGVTRHASTDIAAIPLLWVVPLALYLLTFVIAFARDPRGPVAFAGRAVRLLVIPGALSFVGFASSAGLSIGLHLVLFTAVALLCHSRLALDRPDPTRLTEFYLWVSIGGVVGGTCAALVAPLVFRTVLEYPLALALGVALVPFGAANGDGSRPRVVRWLLAAGFGALTAAAAVVRLDGGEDALRLAIVLLAVAAAGAYALARRARAFAAAMAVVLAVAVLAVPGANLRQERTFFGVYRVFTDGDGQHVFLSGTTVHGRQAFGAAGPDDTPLSYYHPTGPIGQYFRSGAATEFPRAVAVVGLGAGALASYGRPGDTFTFYEIDPAVVAIASDPAVFTFLRDSRASVRTVVGDGRLALAATADRYDTIVLDAFSSDAIPVHLLTKEAVELYLARLRPGGVLAFHVSNRYLDLAPVLGRLAGSLRLAGIVEVDPAAPALAAAGKTSSTWVLLARSGADLAAVRSAGPWRDLGSGAGAPLWTDGFSNVLGVFHLT